MTGLMGDFYWVYILITIVVVHFMVKVRSLLKLVVSLEVLMLTIFVGYCLLSWGYNMSVILIFLGVLVCEASLSLSMLVCLYRSYGLTFSSASDN